MDNETALTLSLPLVGGINWGLIAVAKFDLVARLIGNEFSETDAASRVVYGAVGAASVLGAAPLIEARL